MGIKSVARSFLNRAGYDVYNRAQPHVYSEDGLSTMHVHDFVRDPDFVAAYGRGIQANGGDHFMRWRAHVALWVARQAIQLPGAFVECGVSTGFLASAIMHSLDWNTRARDFYLFDTWQGLDARFLSQQELDAGRLEWYANADFEKVKANFAEFANVHLVRGAVPETLSLHSIDSICYLSLDMNCTEPEIAAIRHFWPAVVPGGFILMDDYAYSGYEQQHVAFNAFAQEVGSAILSLPTGQGLMMKPR